MVQALHALRHAPTRSLAQNDAPKRSILKPQKESDRTLWHTGVGAGVGDCVGDTEGIAVGITVGRAVVGTGVGSAVGIIVGSTVGTSEGASVGDPDGIDVGVAVGVAEAIEGDSVGVNVVQALHALRHAPTRSLAQNDDPNMSILKLQKESDRMLWHVGVGAGVGDCVGNAEGCEVRGAMGAVVGSGTGDRVVGTSQALHDLMHALLKSLAQNKDPNRESKGTVGEIGSSVLTTVLSGRGCSGKESHQPMICCCNHCSGRDM